MPNPDNLVSLAGVRRPVPKNRKKAKKQQQPAFRPRRPEFYMAPVGPNRTLQRIPIPGTGSAGVTSSVSTTFQAPHHQQESMVELSDDTSPNTPLATTIGGWKPVQSVSTPTQNVSPTEIKKKLQKNWCDFKESVTTKPIHKIGEKIKEERPAHQMVTKTKPEEPKKPRNSSEIKWELNVLDEKEEPLIDIPVEPIPAPLPGNPPRPLVAQGTASEIKLFQNKDRVLPSTSKHEEPTTSTVSAPLPKESSHPRQAFINVPMINPKYSETDKKIAIDMMYLSGAYPKGVPRSFLIQQQCLGSIEPQEHKPKEESPIHWTPNMREEPVLQVLTDRPTDSPVEQQYSPSEMYGDIGPAQEGSESPEGQSGQKRLSAFRRLGPVSQPKKPKLTINLLCNKDQSVREVRENEEEEKYTPVHLRKDVIESADETVVKYLPLWPWKRNVAVKKTVTARPSKSVMILEQEQMEEVYEKDNTFIQVSVRGFPRSWKKEHVLDAILDSVKGKSFIPCFTEFTEEECKFLVIRSRSALVAIHKLGFYMRKGDVELKVKISQIELALKQIDFIPRLVLRKQLATGYDGERKLSLKEFTLKSDVSHFIYFPLHRGTNQSELVQLQSTVAWDFLTDLDLSHNRITSIDGLDLPKTTPKLKHLDLSHNGLERVTCLLPCRSLSLRSLRLEHNPLCHDYTDPAHYERVVRMMFPALTHIDGVPIRLKGELPTRKRNYCPSAAELVASRFLEVFFPLLELPAAQRARLEDLYHEQAVLTVTYRYSLRYSSLHRKFRNIFMRARVFDEGEADSVVGAAAIARLLAKWPGAQHDPYSFSLDVLHHAENSTILRVDGILKLTSETLAEDEQMLAFTRTLVLTTLDGVEYKIMNEMVYWDEPTQEMTNTAFQINTVRSSKVLSLKLDSPPDEDLKEKLTEVFMKITELDRRSSERCLELKDWNLKSGLEYFMKLVKLGG